jgi:chorismate lyase/3-hydroxybenzoate synthase
VTNVRDRAVNSAALLQHQTQVEIGGVSPAKSKQCVVDRGAWSPPVTSTQRIPVSNAHPLRTAYVETTRLDTLLNASPSNFLGIVLYGGSPWQPHGRGTCPVVCLDLPQLNEPPLAEVWTSTLPVTYHQVEGIHFAMNGEVLFGAVQLEERPGTPLDIVTYTAYRRLLVQTRALGYPHLLRVWNYFPSINLESNGLERYQRFCVGRHRALAEDRPDFQRMLPAGTAVGTTSGPLKIHFLASTQPGTPVENPRQMNAYEYPRVYGPRSPAFARATLRPSISRSHLFIAGTASVVGHASQHVGKPHQQTLETLHNLDVLITHTEQLHQVTRGQLLRQALFKVYIRHPEHVSTVSDILKQLLPVHTPVLYLQGELCRSELLLEIEGVLSQEIRSSAPSQYEQPDTLTRA